MYQENMNVLSVGDLTRCLRAVLEAEDLFRDVWVCGEVSNLVKHSSGHVYFSLKDNYALLRCVVWRGDARFSFDLSDGMRVVAQGRISVYERQGQYQLTVNELRPDGVGDLFTAYEELKARLATEGLFDEARKKPMPPYPARIAIVTSPKAAALHDMVSIAQRRMPGVDLLLVPALVQGTGSEASVVQALALADGTDADVIVLGRGGGSVEDLWTFNSEAVTRAICSFAKPVVSAVGHETDFTLADLAADLRAPTPSAAMELILPDCRELESRVGGLLDAARSSLESRITERQRVFELLATSSAMRLPERLLQERCQTLDLLSERLSSGFAGRLAERESALSERAASLHSLSPVGVLGRGYAVVRRDGRVVRSAAELAPGCETETLLADGRIISEVRSVEEGWK
ncbi:MAG: exodeoxyribonuclease VII large subunit [Armatimonadota bacterium]